MLLNNADIFILSETWLSKAVSDKDIAINGYNVFRCDRPRKSEGVAIYMKKKHFMLPTYPWSLFPNNLNFLP